MSADRSAETGAPQTPAQQRQPRLKMKQRIGNQTSANIYFTLVHLQHLQADQLESPLLKALDDLAHETTLNSIRLYNDESLFPYIWKSCGDTQNRTSNSALTLTGKPTEKMAYNDPKNNTYLLILAFNSYFPQAPNCSSLCTSALFKNNIYSNIVIS